LTIDYFGDGIEILERTVNGKRVKVAWDWGNFKSTEGFPVDDNLINWVIGQDQALNECFLCLNEWVHKLKCLEESKWYENWSDPNKPKPSAKTIISPAPYLLLFIFFGVFIWWLSRIGGLSALRGDRRRTAKRCSETLNRQQFGASTLSGCHRP